jgi:cell division protease FtsH
MVTRWGMSDKIGLVQLSPRRNPYLGATGPFGADKPFSEETARAIDAEIRSIIEDCHHEALELLRAHRHALDALVEALLKRETLDEQEVLAVTGLPPATPLPGEPLSAVRESGATTAAHDPAQGSTEGGDRRRERA